MNDSSKKSEPILPRGTVTFLFTDIEGSTRLLNQLGEDYVKLLAGHHRLLRDIIARWRGTEVGNEGDAFFVSFPRATDALAAAVEAQRSLARNDWPQGVSVRVRMGLHTGEPWTTSESYAGMDVHRAARIGSVGHGGQVLLSETTAALLRANLPEGVELLDLGQHRLKDMPHPEHIRQLVIDGLPADFPLLKSQGQVSAPDTAVEAPEPPPFLADDAAAPERPVFVGRERQLAWLDEHLQALLDGRSGGNVVFVAGEAGMGKTSLLQAFADRATQQNPDLLVAWGACNAFIGPGDAYLPFRQALAMLSGDVEGAWRSGTLTAEQAGRLWAAYPQFGQAAVDHGREVLVNLVDGPALLKRARSSHPQDARWLARLGQLVEQADHRQVDLSQDRLQQSCSDLLVTIAEKRPLLLLLDDLQWADSTSLNLLFNLARGLSGSRVLIVAAYRPEDVALGRDDARHPLQQVVAEIRRLSGDVVLDLAKTEPGEKRAFVDHLLDSEANALDGDFRRSLFEHTGGQALFTVEMLRYLQDRGDLIRDDAGAWTVGPSLAWDALPDRVEGVIEARISRLEDELRELLNVAAVEGENFTAQVIARVQAIGERSLLRTLSNELEKKHQLVRERSALKRGRQFLSRYRFSHALFQQYLYNDLGVGERQLLHAEIAGILEELYEGRTAEIAVLLGRHYRAAGEDDRALPYLLRSGDNARDLHAFEQAAAHYQEALEILRRRGDQEAVYQTLMKLGQTYHGAFEYERAGEAYEAAFRHLALGRQEPLAEPALSTPATIRWSIFPPGYNTLDFTSTNDSDDGFFISHLFSGLLQLSPKLDILPDIASSWKISDDGLTYRFHLRDDVIWSDGKPVTAHDFAYAWRRILDPQRASPVAGHFSYIKGATDLLAREPDPLGVTVLDDWTLQIELERPVGYFLLLMAQYGKPMPTHTVETHGDAWSDPANIVVNGPYLLDEVPQVWRAGESLKLRRNPTYHGEFPGNVERVDMVIVQTPEEEFEGYELDEFDLAYIGLLSIPDYRRAVKAFSADLYTYPAQGALALIFDTNRSPFDDRRIRRAFALATERQELADERSFAASGGFIPPGLPGHVPDIALPYDLDEARRLLAVAGYPDGHDLPAICGAVYQMRSEYIEHFDRFWRGGLGVSIQWQIVDSLDAAQACHFSILGWNADYPDPDNFLRLALGVLGNWRDRAYDDLIDQANRTMNHHRRMRLFRQAEEMLVDEAPLVPLLYGKREWLCKPWIKNVLPIEFGNVPTHHIIIEPH